LQTTLNIINIINYIKK